tara:strand:+ start:596 stop:1855 length:1260 start_codon:yes stop_codon:yes gene_type:complete
MKSNLESLLMKNILIIGTVDTKSDEIDYMRECIKNLKCNPILMDVSVLGDPPIKVDYTKHDVAKFADMTNKAIIDLGNENDAMIASAKGAKNLTKRLCKENKIDGVIALGGTMGTDLALDVFYDLPLGFPKCLLSTVAGSPLIEPARLPSDIITILWAGGLYGLNSICKSSLSQACGAIVGSTMPSYKNSNPKPIVAITSLGTSALKYIITLLPELDKRGFEAAVFHTTGMGGSAMESLIKQGKISAVMDFSLVEVSNFYFGSEVNSGEHRLEVAGKYNIPQIVAPGGLTVVDAKTWSSPPKDFEGRDFRPHNRLITCAALSPLERGKAAKIIGNKLMKSNGPTAFIMPHGGFDDWDREGEWAFDKEAINSFYKEIKGILKEPIKLYEIKQNINEPEFTNLALKIFDDWVEKGMIKTLI